MDKKMIMIIAAVVIILVFLLIWLSTRSKVSPIASTNPFIGNYGAGTDIALKNGQLVVMTSDGRVSPATSSGNSINVQFVGDPNCCTGTIANKKISWSNGTSWTKN